jgi:hypothetical protein
MEKEGERMMHRKCGTHTRAVAGVIEALLMVALVSIVISMIQLIYIPQVMEQREAEHMDQVFNQISSLKSMMDMQATTQSTAPISSVITLGSRELPYFITAKATGELSTKQDAAFKITVLPPPAGLPSGSVPLTSIGYMADNSYFVDQSYILEGGGIIVKQSEGTSVMRADPSISSVNNTYNITIHVVIPHIIATPGKNSTYGDGKCFIRTNFSSYKTFVDSIPRGGYIQIYSQYLNAWNESLHNILGIYGVNHCLYINITGKEPTGYIQIQPRTKDIRLLLDVVDIQAQIGPGWIK